jgi:tRNA nucleotidyltransferase (CCA-adding enzyme)
MKQPFKEAIPLLKKLHKAGFEAYFVGGSVRDYLLDREISDVDIATSATPLEVKNLFHKTIDVGLEHGTVIVLFEGKQYEITTFRTEGKYEDYRRPSSVTFVRSLLEDLKRRDFTINAMAMSVTGEIIDPFNGKVHLEEKVICAVGNPLERFREDGLRMMRAVRFMSVLQFNLAQETEKAISVEYRLLHKIAIERIAEEWKKLLLGKWSTKAIQTIVSTNMITAFPCINKDLLDRKDFTKLHSESQCWALLFIERSSAEIEHCLKAWKRSNHVIKEIKAIVEISETMLKSKDWTRKLLYSYGEEIVKSAANVYSVFTNEDIETHLKQIEQVKCTMPIIDRAELQFSGKDMLLMSSKKPGPWVGEMMQAIEMAVLQGELSNERNAIKEWVRKWEQQ